MDNVNIELSNGSISIRKISDNLIETTRTRGSEVVRYITRQPGSELALILWAISKAYTLKTMSEAREARGLSLESAAEHLGVKAVTLQRWEIDNSKVKASMVLKIADLYNISLDDLYCGRVSE